MRILGIDPGSRRLGFGVVDYDQARDKATCVDHGVFLLDGKKSVQSRIADVVPLLQTLVSKHAPTHGVVEEVFLGSNARAALILGQMRGAVLAVLGLARVPASSLAPRQVKLFVTGVGGADKFQVSAMVQMLLALKEVPKEDAADALAMALGFAFQNRRGLVSDPLVQVWKTKRTSVSAQRKALAALASRRL